MAANWWQRMRWLPATPDFPSEETEWQIQTKPKAARVQRPLRVAARMPG